ncbi:MAG: sensor histidine kinase [Coprobacillaceae bacterium]
MKKISIYWKTVGISISIILITVVILFTLFSFLLPTITQDIQKQTFASQVERVKEEVETNGVDSSSLAEIEKKGISIFVIKNEEVIYPTFEILQDGTSIYFETSIPEEELIEGKDIYMIPTTENQEDTFVKEMIITHNNIEYKVNVFKYVAFTINDSQLLIETIFPYFIGVGIIVSICFSLIYANFFSKKIKHLGNVMKKMKTKEYSPTEFKENGDELQILENDIISLYKQLCNEIQIVQKLEEERQVFLRGVTHELKTPIMTMGVTIEGILDGVEEYQDQREMLYECYQSLHAMSSLVNEILDIAKIESVKDIGITSASKILREIQETYQYLLEDKEIMIEENIKQDFNITIPQNHLRKILSNIFSNVIKYTPANGKLYIEINSESLYFRNDMYKGVNVDINRALEAFVTYNDKETSLQKSHGLGLYIIVSILQQYNIQYMCWIENQQFHLRIER